MSTKTTTTTVEALAEDRQHVQWIGYNYGGGSGLTTGPVDWQQQQSVDCPCYQVFNSNSILSLSICCLVLILFPSYSFFLFAARNTLSTAIVRKILLYQVYTNLAYVHPTYRRVKYLAHKNGNDILIWIWNNSNQVI